MEDVVYLEDVDFDNSFRLKSRIINEKTGRPYFSGTTIVLVQSNSCGYCLAVKPIFQQLAKSGINADFATIQLDGVYPTERIFHSPDTLASILGQPLAGVPIFVRFERGVPVAIHQGDRTLESLQRFSA